MPRLNAAEQVTTGYAACWFDKGFGLSRTIANDHGGEIRLSNATLIAARPCNFVYANGLGTWMAFHSPAGGSPVVFGDGFEIVGAGMPLGNGSDPVGPDGSILYKQAFNSSGPYGFLGGPDIPGDFDQIQNLGGHRAIGMHNGVLRGFGISVPAVRGSWPRWKDGWLLYQSAETAELVLGGRVVAPSGNHFRPDFSVREDRSVLVVSSPDAGETITSRYEYTAAQFVSLPLWQPKPTPVPVPPPVKEPSVIPNRIADVAQIRAEYPTPLAHRHAAFLIEVAKFLKGKLFRKDGGAHVTLPNGVNVSMDILILPQQRDSNGGLGDWWIDILGDAENKAVAIWDAHPDAGGEFVDVSGIDTGGIVAPPSSDGLAERVEGLESIYGALFNASIDHGNRLADLQRAEADQLDQIHQLDATTVKVGDLQGYAKRGDAVEVKGRVSLRDAYGNKELTWAGKIK